MATVLVGHVTKDGAIAGPARCWSTWSTSCCTSRATGTRRLRLVRAIKNRFGPADEVGCFELRDDGHRRAARPVRAVPVPRAPSRCPAPASPSPWRAAGRCWPRCRRWSPRPAPAAPRRAVSGLDAARVAMVLAVLERRGRVQARPSTTSTSRRSAACGSPSRRPTWPSRWRWRQRARGRAAARRHWSRSARWAWPARSAGCRRRPPAGRGGPAGLHRARWSRPTRGGRPPAGMRLDRGRRPAARRCDACPLATGSRRVVTRSRRRPRRVARRRPDVTCGSVDGGRRLRTSGPSGAHVARRRGPRATLLRDSSPRSRPAPRCATAWSASCAATPAR